MRIMLGGVSVFCFLDAVFVLSLMDVVDGVWPLTLYGSIVAFVVGLLAPEMHSAYRWLYP